MATKKLIIEESNRIIAEFMGIEYLGKDCDGGYDMCRVCECEKTLHYHEKWGWLLPVVAKCYTADSPDSEGWRKAWRIENRIPRHAFESNHIEGVYKAVVEFIQWYNETKKTQ